MRNIILESILEKNKKVFLRRGKQLINGSPVIPERQTQTGLWLMTLQSVLRPQLPGQGSRHFWLVHASFFGQSELITHSGLQVGGAPTNPFMQLHTACILFSRHWLFGPHGDGLQGLLMGGATRKDFNYRIKIQYTKNADIWGFKKNRKIFWCISYAKTC